MSQSMPPPLFRLLVLCLVLGMGLGGCVRSTEGSFSESADKAKAEQAYVRLGLAYLQEEQYDRARQHLNRALEINRKSAEALAGLGLLNQVQGEMEVAEERFLESIAADGDYTRGRSYYGAFLYGEQRYEEALEQFEIAAQDREYDGRPGVFIKLGRTAQALGRHDRAAEAYLRALRLDRGNQRALEGALVNLVEAGRFEEAAPLYERLRMSIRATEAVDHSPATLWAGIRIADYYDDQDRVSSLALLLRKRYPDSLEYQQYKAMKAND
ncbi:MAG: tetratricopeptide repeat protein [Oleiphilaceae bacterium]|nr:tetratricopeptide repeat protein [Oleiphilaceae bacterium]